jgi:ribose transport system substrate-binding protein
MTERKRKLRAFLIIGMLAALSIFVAACGGGSSSSSSSEPSASETSEPAETAEASETSETAETSETSESSEGSAEVEEVLAEATGPAKWEGPTEPDPAAPDKKILFILTVGGTEGQELVEDGGNAAAKAIGWNISYFRGEGTPQSYAEGISQAINEKVDGVVFSSITPSLIVNQMKELKAAGIPSVAISNTVEPEEELWLANIGYNPEKEAKFLAADIAKGSNGEAHIMTVNDKEFGVVEQRFEAFKKILPELCPKCTIEEETEMQVTELETKIGPKIGGLLQANPNVDYIYAPYDDAAVPMIAAVKQAGLQNEVQIVSYGGYKQSTEYIREGNVQSATIANAVPWQSWEALDVLNRHFTKKEIPQAALNTDPVKLITKESLPPAGQLFTGDEAEYEKHYEELWAGK